MQRRNESERKRREEDVKWILNFETGKFRMFITDKNSQLNNF